MGERRTGNAGEPWSVWQSLDQRGGPERNILLDKTRQLVNLAETIN